MLFFLGCVGITNFINYGLNYFYQVSNRNANSISIMTNSAVVGLGCSGYLGGYWDLNVLKYIFDYNAAFLLGDIVFKYQNNFNNDFYIKLVHHILALYGIYRLEETPYLISLLFMTELTNLPLEGRFLLINLGYRKYFMRQIMVGLLYLGFGYLRIYYPLRYVSQNYGACFPKQIDLICFQVLYSLWVYWFILINRKIYHKLQPWVADFRGKYLVYFN